MIESLNLSGYEDQKELLAQRYTRAGKSLFVVALPLHLVGKQRRRSSCHVTRL